MYIVGAVGKNQFDVNNQADVANFYLTYDQITSVNVSGGWLTLIAGSSRYTLKPQNADSVAAEIQRNIRRKQSGQ